MIIIGAKGHAKELLPIAEYYLTEKDTLFFFDDVSTDGKQEVFEKYKIIKEESVAAALFDFDDRFVLGVGGGQLRNRLAARFIQIGGKLTTVKSRIAQIGMYEVFIGDGANIMDNAFISNSVYIGTGSLINQNASIHHDVQIGIYCEVSPGCMILGGALIGNYVSLGAGAIVLPKIKIADNVVVGAGAVVTKDILEPGIYVGTPAKRIK